MKANELLISVELFVILSKVHGSNSSRQHDHKKAVFLVVLYIVVPNFCVCG